MNAYVSSFGARTLGGTFLTFYTDLNAAARFLRCDAARNGSTSMSSEVLGVPHGSGPLDLATIMVCFACAATAEGVESATDGTCSVAGVGALRISSTSIVSAPFDVLGAGEAETGDAVSSVLVATATAAGLPCGVVASWAARDNNPAEGGAGSGRLASLSLRQNQTQLRPPASCIGVPSQRERADLLRASGN